MNSILDVLVSLSGPTAYALVGGLAFGEAVFLLGFVLPGELAVVLGGVLASHGRASLPAMMAVVAAGAVLGDSVSYELGRQLGPRLLTARLVQRHVPAVDAIQRLMRRWGTWAVVIGRATAYLRPLVPAVAGVAGMRYRRFLLANAAGGVAWAAGFTGLGYLLGDAYRRATAFSHWTGLALAGCVVMAVALMAWRRRRRRPDRSFGPAIEPQCEEGGAHGVSERAPSGEQASPA